MDLLILRTNSRILFSKSVDEGVSWTIPIAISEHEGDCLDGDNTVEGAVPAVGPDGQIYVAWAGQYKIYFDRSLDRGESWLKRDIIVAPQRSGWEEDVSGVSRANGMPVTKVDISKGKYDGRIYINWTDTEEGETDLDVWLCYSDDGGLSWSVPSRVNDDNTNHDQFFTWMDVDPKTGYVYIVFYDRRNYEDDLTDVYLAYSIDGGQTFTNKKISQSPFRPILGPFFGDYNNISAFDGIVRPIWTRQDDMVLSIWTAIINHK